MQKAQPRPSLSLSQSPKSFTVVVVLVFLAVVGLVTYSIFKAVQTEVPPISVPVISEQTLAEQYGLGVNLVAVTAAGGMVDLRLGIIDGAKAKTLLGDQANFPSLLVGDGVVLHADEDVASESLNFEDGSSVFLLYPNAQSVVKPGDPVTIVFGDFQVEAIAAK
ncbi:MAG: hypothetical protein ACK2UW_21945 [Anaerolineales bacterium]|jgi:hypothetical protein